MSLYIYDNFLNQFKYNSVLKNIENSMTRLGLNGKISRFDVAQKKIDIENKLKQGLKTLIVVGDDSTVIETLGVLFSLHLSGISVDGLAFGIIPVGKENYIADNLGIEYEEKACEVIAQRIVKKLDLGIVNNKTPFVVNAFLKSHDSSILIDKQYSLDVPKGCNVNILNLNANILEKNIPNNLNVNPQDGILELVVKERSRGFFAFKKNKHDTVVACKKAMVRSNNLSRDNYLFLDNFYKVALPAKINVFKNGINFILSKNRKFQ